MIGLLVFHSFLLFLQLDRSFLPTSLLFLMNILTWNVHGLCSSEKQFQIFTFLQNFHPDIPFLQETNLSNNGKLTFDNWNLDVFSSPRVTLGSGVMIAFKRSASLRVSSFMNLYPGYLMRLDFEWNESSLVCYNIYMPQSDDAAHSVFDCLDKDLLTITAGALFILGGDFNCTLSPALNRSTGSEYRRTLQKWLSDLVHPHLSDAWREMNPDNRMYTYTGTHSNKPKSRLDRFYVSCHSLTQLAQVKINSIATLSDHCPVTLTFFISSKV